MNTVEQFGDYQTPIELANKILAYLKNNIEIPELILEPTCGVGAFIKAARKVFPKTRIIGLDINATYLKKLEMDLIKEENHSKINLRIRNFFEVNWNEYFKTFKAPILVIGNPPWITSSKMSVINGKNLPNKSNIKKFPGIEALTGKSNFDISEWMIMQLLFALNEIGGNLAMLCKLSVARELYRCFQFENLKIKSCKIFLIDVRKYFNADVDACLFFVSFNGGKRNPINCEVFNGLNDNIIQEIGFKKNNLIARVNWYEKWKHLEGKSRYTWRSGIKHDASNVMELIEKEDAYHNGYGDEVKIESTYLYPMFKSSDLAKEEVEINKRWMIVTQKKIGEDTSIIKEEAPLTWKYLIKHSEKLDKRKSSIYKGKPRFSVFGVGDYTFKPWKIAISGFYKSLEFHLIPPFHEKPVVFDDTCYFLSTSEEKEAILLLNLLKQERVKEFYQSFIFWDAKRPITKNILKKLYIEKLIEKK